MKIIIAPALKGVLIFNNLHPLKQGQEGDENHHCPSPQGCADFQRLPPFRVRDKKTMKIIIASLSQTQKVYVAENQHTLEGWGNADFRQQYLKTPNLVKSKNQ